MKIYKNIRPEEYKNILKRPAMDTTSLFGTVRNILDDIKINGDSAVKKYAAQFDKSNLANFQVTEKELEIAENQLNSALKSAILTAKSNIERFHSRQVSEPEVIETMTGIQCWRKSIGIEKVGLYIPGGTAPLFSTVLMLGIPARIAGCKDVVLCTPCKADGAVHPAILFAAKSVGISKIFKIGGVQAIGAMAYGTESVPQVFKIFGPGNQYVTAAKQVINTEGVAIDMPAGPSEVMVIADATANPDYVAADLLSQAEHGIDSQVVLLAYDETIVENILKSIENQLLTLPRADISRKALENSIAIIVKNDDEAMAISNEYAPEHLILSTENADNLAAMVVNAGSVFIGHYSPESVGDYASGTNHTLPTNGYAKAYSGVSVDSFVKKITYQKLNTEGLKNIGNAVILMAEAEQLDAHARAVSIRLASL
jgi:histidinol dehydrogenase